VVLEEAFHVGGAGPPGAEESPLRRAERAEDEVGRAPGGREIARLAEGTGTLGEGADRQAVPGVTILSSSPRHPPPPGLVEPGPGPASERSRSSTGVPRRRATSASGRGVLRMLRPSQLPSSVTS